MAGTPPSTGVRRIIGPSHAYRMARLVMFSGSALQAGALVVAGAMILDLRGSHPATYDAPVLEVAIAAYLLAAFVTSYGYSHLNLGRAVLFVPLLALVGFLVLVLAVLTGDIFAGSVITRLEGEPGKKPDTNFATTLITSGDAIPVLGGPATAPGETHGFGSSVSSCEVHRLDGRGYLLLRILQGPAVPRNLDRMRGGGEPVDSVGDRAFLSRRRLVILVADTMVELMVVGVKLDDAKRAALVDVGRTIVARLRPPALRGVAAGLVQPSQGPNS